MTTKITRRTALKGAGALMGSTAIYAPAVHAQEPKVLRYLGTAVNQSTEIAKKVKEDTGITIEYIPVTTDEVTKRVVTQPNSFDIVDEEYFSLKKVIPSGNLLLEREVFRSEEHTSELQSRFDLVCRLLLEKKKKTIKYIKK